MNLFLAACRATVPLRLGVSYSGAPEMQRRSFGQPFVVIGRHPGDADLALDDSEVSDRHAYLQMIGGRVFCVDLGSRTGVQWGQKTGRSGWVQPQQALRLGRCTVRVLESGPESVGSTGIPGNPLARHAPEGDPLPKVRLEIRNGAAAQKPWQMNRVLALVGRAPECKVHVVGARVSSFHCSLVRTPHGVWAVDLLTRSGILVNENSLRWAWLDDGDELRVGNFVIRLRYETPPFPLPVEAAPPRPVEQFGAPEGSEDIAHALIPAGRPAMSGALPAGVPLRMTDAASALLLPLAEQFAAMQQQMFAQFQQGMAMMFQMFHAAQQEQLGQVREELDRLRDITQELTTLQSELLRQNLEPPRDTAARPSAPSARPGRTPPARAEKGGSPPASSPPPSAAQGPDPANPTPRPGGVAEQPQDVHAWLTQRIAGLEQERQGRWQKILNFLRGK
jgi:pSer/pThr/pTyr-binding forkhead associated (FHA) protein